MKFVGGEVVAGLKKCPQNGIPLGSLLQAHSLEMAMQDVLGFPHHLAREAGLIVDAFLQHGVKSSPSVPGPLAALRVADRWAGLRRKWRVGRLRIPLRS